MAVAAGVNVLVAGSPVFGATKPVTAGIEALREAAIQAAH
jgi:pentose-5-phosphate-3-epimerase